ncbi:hypothetical protein EWM64_g4454 [Hericium alpestre]|uniref:CBF1-interacting co-repressor CIR N-terminal domain-containing protein n=1 Tax=Hericium alpestre TaxID=135208 RepID=A0A4Y9ZZD1_9AGAM|nr:hypothetical protein EWM64_g4454 [Hericium alpestre]
MGGGDLNMKKSWHPLLLKNQERVWLEEKKALEEKKKLDQLRKEKEEERQMQELQRMQEEQTGKKRAEKLEWMYSTPATGSSQNQNDLEDYLLGKKRVDKILVGDEHEKLGAAHKNFIAVQNANTARDTAAKIREDPLFAIKQQEAAAYEALMSNPLRLREMQERNGIKPKKEKKKEKKEKRRRERDDRSLSPASDYDRSRRSRRSVSPRDRQSPLPYRSRYGDDFRRREDDYAPHRGRSRDRSPESRPRRSYPSPTQERRRSYADDTRRGAPWPRSDESESPDEYTHGRSQPQPRSVERHGRYEDDRYKRPRSRSPVDREPSYSKRARMSPPPPRHSSSRPPHGSYEPSSRPSHGSGDRAARLAAMTSNASSLDNERKERLTALLEKEKAELEAEERRRAKSKGMGSFLSHEQKKVFGGSGGLEERLRRGRAGLVAEGD